MSSDAEGARATLWVEVAYATPEKQSIRRVEVPAGTTVAQAIERSGLREEFPAMRVSGDLVGVFSRRVPMDHVLQEGDRVEIYRPLIADPRESRRKRAASPRRAEP